MVVLMSGGVDSAVAAALLKERGERVIGLTFKMWRCEDVPAASRQRCCSPRDIADARRVAGILGIPHAVLDIGDVFAREVVDPFCAAYAAGETPNPCVVCNARVKFGELRARIESIFGTARLATGHYARIVRHGRNRYLAAAADPAKDQSYFLAATEPSVLAAVEFPLGDLCKDAVREKARGLRLPVAAKRDSHEICFVAGDYRRFLRERGCVAEREGPILEADTGRQLGRHRGFINYTLGQRAGLGLGGLTRRYVVDIDPAANAVYVGPRELLDAYEVVSDVVMLADGTVAREPSTVRMARIRHQAPLTPCTVSVHGRRMHVLFRRPQFAPTPGQYVVVYAEDGRVLACGRIVRPDRRGVAEERTAV